MLRCGRGCSSSSTYVRFYGGEGCSDDEVYDQWSKWTARCTVGLAAAESVVQEGAPPPIEVYLKYLYYSLLPEVLEGAQLWRGHDLGQVHRQEDRLQHRRQGLGLMQLRWLRHGVPTPQFFMAASLTHRLGGSAPLLQPARCPGRRHSQQAHRPADRVLGPEQWRGREGTLREACDTGLYNTVVISFYGVFGQHGHYWQLDLSGHPLDGVGADIKHCQQSKGGITVFLSIGGDSGSSNNYSRPSAASAEAVAAHLWNAYLGGGASDVPRPFGDAVLDGIDFYIDHGDDGSSTSTSGNYYAELARRLDYFNSMYYQCATNKYVRLTATPRCAFPDQRVEEALATGLFERIHVRFYGSDGNGDKDDNGRKWTAAYPRSQMYVGLAAAETLEGAPPPVEVYLKYMYYDLLPKVQKAPNYGGVMVWDRFADKNTGYSTAVKGWASCSYGGCIYEIQVLHTSHPVFGLCNLASHHDLGLIERDLLITVEWTARIYAERAEHLPCTRSSLKWPGLPSMTAIRTVDFLSIRWKELKC
ncbi:hypothetical protein U9M48_000395 [Paspalum notatum var. saurae]|uniref:GH18 domain-containing protein n=1 Tax=Paspalum notatum var. saurae TaxID=547442 RepID=A0AAQ3PLF0_PASNO